MINKANVGSLLISIWEKVIALVGRSNSFNLTSFQLDTTSRRKHSSSFYYYNQQLQKLQNSSPATEEIIINCLEMKKYQK